VIRKSKDGNTRGCGRYSRPLMSSLASHSRRAVANANAVNLIYCSAEKAITQKQTKIARSNRAAVRERTVLPGLREGAQSADLSSQLICDKAKRPTPSVATNHFTGLNRIQHGHGRRKPHLTGRVGLNPRELQHTRWRGKLAMRKRSHLR